MLGKSWAICLTWTLHAIFSIFSGHSHIESALLLKIMWLKVERSSPQFRNLNLLRTKRNETKLNFLRISLFKHYLASLLIVRWPDQGPSKQNLLWTINTNLVLKFNLSTNFFATRKNISCTHVHQKLTFSAHLIAYARNKLPAQW